MSDFPDALNVVLDHLVRTRENGGAAAAGLAVLTRLAATRDTERPTQVAETPANAPRSLRPAPEALRLARIDAEPAIAEYKPLTNPAGTKAERLAQLHAIAATCQKCPHLAASRHRLPACFASRSLEAGSSIRPRSGRLR